MKRNLKIITLFAIFLQFICFYTKVDARGMEFKAKNAGDGGIIFETYIGAFPETIASYKDGIHVKNEDNFSKSYNRHNFYYLEDKSYYIGNKVGETRKFISPWGDDVLNGYNDNTVRSWSFLIHNKEFTKYDDSGNMYTYSTKSSNSDIPSTKVNKIDIIGENSNVNSIEFKRLSEGYQLIKPNNFSEPVSVDSDKFPKSYIDEILKDKDKYITQNSNGTSYCYISEPLTFNYNEATKEKTWYSKRDVKYKDTNSNEIKTINNANVGLKTAYDIHNKDQKDFNGSYLTVFKGLKGYNGVNSTPLNSFINYYDNKLILPNNIIGQKDKVYVRHILKQNGKQDEYLGNTEEILINSNGDVSTITSRNNLIENKARNDGYREGYEIEAGNQLKVSRLLTLVKDSEYYKLTKVSYASGTSYTDAANNSKQSKGNQDKIPNTVGVTGSGQGKVHVITFTYKVNVPENDTPEGGIKTIDSKDNTQNCQMSYTPTKEYITPYLIANKLKFVNLKYKYKIEGKNIKFEVENFKVDKLISGNIMDNESYKDDVGKIFGGNEDRETLLIGDKSKTFNVINDIDKKINELKELQKLPNYEQLTNIAKMKTSKENSTTKFLVPENRYNGLRIPKLTANYQEYDVVTNTPVKTKSIDVNNILKVLVYNPIKIGSVSVISKGVVDHSTVEKNSAVIQKNANFDLTIDQVSGNPYVGHTYSEYLDKYYLIFDISIIKTDETKYSKLYKVNGENLEELHVDVKGEIPRGTIIELEENQTKFSAKAGQTNKSDTISQSTSQITLIGSSNNMPGDWLKTYVLSIEKNNLLNSEKIKNYISNETNSTYQLDTDTTGSYTNVKLNYCDGNIDYKNYKVHNRKAYNDKNMYGDAYYFAKTTTSVTNIGRIYDFKVTDCSDIDYKKVFRKTTGNNVNSLTGVEYFSGIKKFSIFSNDVNTLEDREDVKSVSSSSKTILPLGPYKNTDTSYVNAPKMGYRISFDLKTSGYYNYTANAENSERKIQITPSYYYISKDGKTYKSNIDLYYKNSDGKYVKFVGSDYTIYFKPKDGYRTKTNSTTTPDNEFMSEQLEPLKIGSSKGFTLDYKMMNTSNDNFIQSWYGEFKLPNSTIVTENGNVSKPLTDGYVGVKFNIECIDTVSSKNEKTISYNTNNKNADPNINTSQWDYEGYLGFSNPGSKADNITLQLEKGIWTVYGSETQAKTQATYNGIKGTVVLFDLDNRAANDFD